MTTPFKTILSTVAWLVPAAALLPSLAAATEYCREYTRTISVGSHRAEGHGTACREPDGTWRIASGDGADVRREDDRAEYRVEGEPVRIVRETSYVRRPAYVVSETVYNDDDDGWRGRHHHHRHDNGWRNGRDHDCRYGLRSECERGHWRRDERAEHEHRHRHDVVRREYRRIPVERDDYYSNDYYFNDQGGDNFFSIDFGGRF